MLRPLGLIAVCACIAASVACDGAPPTAPGPPPNPSPASSVTVEFGGRVVNADAGGPVGNVRVSVLSVGFGGRGPAGWSDPKDTATSGGDGTFALLLTLPSVWKNVNLTLTGPAGYDDLFWDFQPKQSVRTGVEFRMYPTLVIRPGESIDVRVEGIESCGFAGEAGPCRRVLVAASPGDPVELELVPDDTSKPMALSPDDWAYMPVRRLMVPPGGIPYVIGAGTARLTARR